MVRIDDYRWRAAKHVHRGYDSGGGVLADELAPCIPHFGDILIWHQPKADLCDCFRGDDGFRANAGKTARDAVHLQRRPRPDAFEDHSVLLASKNRRADFLRAEIGFPKAESLPALNLRRGGVVD